MRRSLLRFSSGATFEAELLFSKTGTRRFWRRATEVLRLNVSLETRTEFRCLDCFLDYARLIWCS